MSSNSPQEDETTPKSEEIKNAETQEEIKSRHSKELKALDGQKRAALKKAKQTGGKSKKAKETINALDSEFDSKEKETKQRHETELHNLNPVVPPEKEHLPQTEEKDPITSIPQQSQQIPKKLSKSQKKRQKEKEKEAAREKEIEEELKNMGPTAREVELQRMHELYLDPLNLIIKEIPADGNCLFRAIGDSIGLEYSRVRALCGDTLEQHSSTFEPFCESDNFIEYCQRVRGSSDWGGELELRVLALGLKRKIIVYSADCMPITMGEGEENGDDILLSYHKSYYSLGEHYNAVKLRF